MPLPIYKILGGKFFKDILLNMRLVAAHYATERASMDFSKTPIFLPKLEEILPEDFNDMRLFFSFT